MTNTAKTPETLIEAIRYFADPDVSLDFVARLRWRDGKAICPTCGRDDVRFIPTRRIWECKSKHPKRQFSVKVGTIFEDSPIALDKWLATIWLIANAKNGVSSYEVHRSIGVTQKTAWFMLHRIRLALQSDGFGKMGGEVEVDETWIGGKARFMHKARQERIKGKSHGFIGKTAVFGLLERQGPEGHSAVRAKVVRTNRRSDLFPLIRENIAHDAEVMSDSHPTYHALSGQLHFAHEMIDHAEEYVRGKVHTNGMENFWSLLKRTVRGTYVSVEPFHLFRYLDEQTFRFNNRKTGDGGRFERAAGGIVGKRLMYRDLIGANTTPA
jgi:transposase-like protein